MGIYLHRRREAAAYLYQCAGRKRDCFIGGKALKTGRMVCSDMKRLFVSKNFYFTVTAVMLLCFLSVLGEFGIAKDIYYLVEARHGVGAFLMAMLVLAVLPFGLSYREDCENNYIHGIRGRIGCGSYCFSKILTAATGTFAAVFFGICSVFGCSQMFLSLGF